VPPLSRRNATITVSPSPAHKRKTDPNFSGVPLFDYSQLRPDNNTNNLLNSCIRQLKHLCSLYTFVTTKLSMFVSNRGNSTKLNLEIVIENIFTDVIAEQFNSLQTVSVYFEVLQWLLNVGLLPECPITAYPRSDDLERINAPYPAEMLTEFYNHRRALLKILNEEKFSSSESVLFIDTLIEKECGGKLLQEYCCHFCCHLCVIDSIVSGSGVTTGVTVCTHHPPCKPFSEHIWSITSTCRTNI
jgi:hypothetical protein